MRPSDSDLSRMTDTHFDRDAPPHALAPACSCGAGPMLLVRVHPGFGPIPELRTFRCSECGAVETVEFKKGAGHQMEALA